MPAQELSHSHHLPKQETTQEHLETDRETTELLKLIFEQHPFLAHVKINFVSPEDEPNTGGFFHRVKIDEHTFVPTVTIVLKDTKHLEQLMKTRAPSVAHAARMLGIKIEELSTDLLSQFIIAHEFGHATDYIKNYETNPDYHAAEATQEWDTHYDANLLTLPVPGFDPVDLMEEVSQFHDVDTFFQTHPEVQHTISGVKIKNLRELVDAQEFAYRASTYENYADQFAVNFLRRNSEALGIKN